MEIKPKNDFLADSKTFSSYTPSSPHTIALSKGIIFQKKRRKNADFVQKIADISKIKKTLVLKGIFSETMYVCTHTHIQSHTHTHTHTHTYTYTQNRPRKSQSRLGIRVKDLTKIRNRSESHHYKNSGCQGKNFQSFLYRFSIHEMALFRVFF